MVVLNFVCENKILEKYKQQQKFSF